MTREEILEYFKDINYAYNDCTRYDTLKRMLDELQEPCSDAISRQAVLDEINRIGIKAFETYGDYSNLYDFVDKLPSVIPVKRQKPCTDAISRVEEAKETIRKIDENVFCIPSITDRILMDISISLAVIADKHEQRGW